MLFRRASIPKIEMTRFFLLRLAIILFIAFFRTADAGNFYAGVSPVNVPWPGGIVPYEFTNTLTAAQTNTYLAGLREWELAGNVKFVPHTTETHWILFSYNTNFQDYVDSGSNPQMVTINSLSRAQVCHEMGHSFGFNHENIRTDATNYITILTNNIVDEPDNLHWFVPDPTTVTNGNYDYESVMHLGWDFDSTSPGVLATQQPKPPNFPRYQFRLGNYCLSPGDRAALAYLYGPPAVPLTNIVTTTADVGPGSLRAAIYYVTDHPGAVVKFNLLPTDPGYSNGVFNIHLTGHLPPLVANGMVIDGSTQPGFTGKPLIVVDASQIIPETFTSDTVLIYSSSNRVKNISFTGFDWNGLTLVYADATNNTISGCWLGLDATGTNAAPNAGQGILIAAGARGNIIGGTNELARNVISGNSQYGVFITDSNTTGNVVLGNYLGTDPTGNKALANGLSGIFIGVANGNIIGSANPAGRNIISGNTEYGIYLTSTTNNVILGNYIGVNAGGESALGNGLSGVGIFSGAQSNYLGGIGSGAGNVISGNQPYGIFISGAEVDNNQVLGNFIGTDAAGTGSPGTQQYGIGILAGASANIIGGADPGARNVISGNLSYGLYISDPGTSNNFVLGNFIGPDVTGTAAIGDGGFGIGIWNNASGNFIGGTAVGAGNLISGNSGFSYGLAMGGVTGNVVQGNEFGTDLTGNNALANGFANVAIESGSTSNLVGGIGVGAGNVIAFSGGYGVVVYDPDTINNSIRGNSIFSNAYLGIDLIGDGVTPNHTGFLAGPNDLQNFPVITNAYGSGTSTIVLGKLNSLSGGNFLIDVYRSYTADESGYGEGQFYLGTVNVTTDGSGNAPFAYTNSGGNFAGQFITATATAANGDTSEFSAAVTASNAAMASAQFGTAMSWQASGFVFNLTFQTNFSYHIQATTNLAGNPVPWVNLTNFTAVNSSLNFTDRSAINFRTRFYRVVSP
jgi:parallel beta-helix repeat protein